MATLRIPLATYRLQFNAQFRFDQARSLVDYFAMLGITDIYASPLLQAQRGSLHGYDVTDPLRLNPEIGSESDFERWMAELQNHEMGLLLDIVPNHMAASSENPWWMDVLEDGPGSAYASFFDIDWHPPRTRLQNKVLLPILGRPYAQALESQDLKLIYEQGGFFIRHFETKLPLAPKTYLQVLQHGFGEFQQRLGPDHPSVRELGGILAALSNLPERAALSVEMAGERRMQREALKERLWNLNQNSVEVRQFVDQNLQVFNGRKRDSASFVYLDRLLADQSYFLSYWLSANDEINYRRFFAISNLVGVRVEDPLVFEATQSVILRLVERGLVTGLRIDHVDGLRDPHGYLRRLQERVAGATGTNGHPPFYVIVEKILADGERLPAEWPICGATGYSSLNALNELFVDSPGAKQLQHVYEQFLGAPSSYEDLVYQRKKEVMNGPLAVEMRALGHHLALLAEQDRYARDLPLRDVARALTETTACLTVYRTYIRGFSINRDERQYIEQAIETARQRNPGLGSACFEFVSDVLLLREKAHVLAEQREAWLAFVMRWQQFTGPIMAKGAEDSALYLYNSLISLNEVGGRANSTGLSVGQLHEFFGNRHGHTLTATSTHDTKRSEDVRARINVLSEMPDTWQSKLLKWAAWNEPQKKPVGQQIAPDPNESIFLYETMLGAWPLDPSKVPAFRKRLQHYMVKALREGSVHTTWTSPSQKYELAVLAFIRAVTKQTKTNLFLTDFAKWSEEIAYYGVLNSLSQLLLKVTVPGVPDLYQGSELWDFRLVDPDNRGPVDFEKRARLLAQIGRGANQDRLACIQEMLDHWKDGRIKLYITSVTLNFRRHHRELFLEGDYQPLPVRGSHQENVFAFARRAKEDWMATAVPRLISKLTPPGRLPVGDAVWADDGLVLPRAAPRVWTNVLTGETLQVRHDRQKCWLALAEVFKRFPVATLTAGVSS